MKFPVLDDYGRFIYETSVSELEMLRKKAHRMHLKMLLKFCDDARIEAEERDQFLKEMKQSGDRCLIQLGKIFARVPVDSGLIITDGCISDEDFDEEEAY